MDKLLPLEKIAAAEPPRRRGAGDGASEEPRRERRHAPAGGSRPSAEDTISARALLLAGLQDEARDRRAPLRCLIDVIEAMSEHPLRAGSAQGMGIDRDNAARIL